MRGESSGEDTPRSRTPSLLGEETRPPCSCSHGVRASVHSLTPWLITEHPSGLALGTPAGGRVSWGHHQPFHTHFCARTASYVWNALPCPMLPGRLLLLAIKTMQVLPPLGTPRPSWQTRGSPEPPVQAPCSLGQLVLSSPLGHELPEGRGRVSH